MLGASGKPYAFWLREVSVTPHRPLCLSLLYYGILEYPLQGTLMNMNVSLTEELANFVKAKVGTGRYASSSEVVREALRLMESLERREAEKLGFLRKAWQEGIDSGDAGKLDMAALKQEARARLAASKD
jgi:antitoxin ParD1/3/4